MKTRIMVIIGVGALLGAVLLLPDYIKSHTPSSKSACIANLKQIEGAKATWALENKKTEMDTPTEADLYGSTAYIRDKPECELSGRYILGRMDQYARCTVPSHFMEFSSMHVDDESGEAVKGAHVEVRRTNARICGVDTGADGRANLGSFGDRAVFDWWDGTKHLVVSKGGYETEYLPMPTNWPLRVVLKKEHK